jgi:hypothetical protein
MTHGHQASSSRPAWVSECPTGSLNGPAWSAGSAVDLDDRSGALVIRVWLEGGGDFRARVIAAESSDPSQSGAERTIAVAASPGEVVTAVRGWLDDFLRGATNPVDSH